MENYNSIFEIDGGYEESLTYEKIYGEIKSILDKALSGGNFKYIAGALYHEAPHMPPFNSYAVYGITGNGEIIEINDLGPAIIYKDIEEFKSKYPPE